MVVGKAIIRNAAGIHVRPAGVITGAARNFDGAIIIRAHGMETDLSGVLGLIAMGLSMGDEVEIEVTGPDEAGKLAELAALFEQRFNFVRQE